MIYNHHTSNLANKLLNILGYKANELNAEIEPLAHINEHSIDNQIPFLQYLYKTIEILPICLMDHSLSTCRTLANTIAKLILEHT